MWISASQHPVSPVSALQTSHSLRSSTCDVSSNDYELQCELCCAAPGVRSQEPGVVSIRRWVAVSVAACLLFTLNININIAQLRSTAR